MTLTWRCWCWKLGLASLLAMGGAIADSGDYAKAQITPDGTLGTESSVVTPTNNNGLLGEQIDGGAIRGTNLFHSFEQFSVPNGSAAYFNNALDIQNIISRVTGSSISNIDGLLRANGTANLFLLNPNGIIFGPNASLNIGGSFVGSTASSINFADRTQFSATAPQNTPLLTVSVPIGLQFGAGVGTILNQSVAVDSSGRLPVGLQVQPGNTLALVGGDVLLEGGNLTAESGRIELGSVAGSSLVSLTPNPQGWVLGYEGVQNFKDIKLSQTAFVYAGGEGGGDVQVRGRHVTLTNGSQIVAFTRGSQPGGTLVVNASDSVELTGFINTLYGQVPSGLRTDSFGSRSDSFGLRTTSLLGSSDVGDLTINTRQLIVNDGAFVSAGTGIVSTGQGGNLTVNASDSVELRGAVITPDVQFPSGLFAQTQGAGDAGNLTINTKRLIAQDGAQVTAGAGIGSQGKGGNLTVNASESVELSGTLSDGEITSGLFARTRGTGSAGNLTIATGQLSVQDRAVASVSSQGAGDAGNLEVAARSIRLNNQATLTAESALGRGGNITLQARDLLLMRHGSLTSAISGGSGSAGNIAIDTGILASLENSDIIANAFAGPGANISIKAQAVFGTQSREQLTPESDITATGVVVLVTPDVDPNRGLVNLPSELVDASGLISQSCPGTRGNTGKGESEFMITGRGGLPPNPSEALRSDAVRVDLGTPIQVQENRASAAVSTNSTRVSAPTAIVEAQGWVIGANGEVILTDRPPTVTPHRPWLAAADCRPKHREL